MKQEITLDTLVMAKRALEELIQWHLERAVKDIEEFVRAGFKEDGSYNIEGHFPAVSNNGKNCKWCEFSKLYNVCPKENRI